MDNIYFETFQILQLTNIMLYLYMKKYQQNKKSTPRLQGEKNQSPIL